MSEGADGFRGSMSRHLVDDVLAWWTEHGPDDQYGGVLTCWDNAGRTLRSTDKFTWSQGRWAWLTARVAVAARAGVLDVDADHYASLATSTAEFVREHALLEDGSTAFVTDQRGRPRETSPGAGLHTSVFADLFVALGFAAVSRLGDPVWSQHAERLLVSASERISSGTARSEPYPVPAGHRSFALPMILVNVAEQVHRATESAISLEILCDAAGQIDCFFRRGADVVEMPAMEAGRDDTLLAWHRTPGHVLECLWFLEHAADLLPDAVAPRPWAADAAEHALALGWDETFGGLFRYTDGHGGSPTGRRTTDRYEAMVVDTWDTKLWWVHAEALYATALLARTSGRTALAEWHERLRAYTAATFPDGPGREWTQTRNRDGSPLEATVALPVKDPFHVARSLLLLVELDHSSDMIAASVPSSEAP